MRRWIGWTLALLLAAGGLVALARGGSRDESGTKRGSASTATADSSAVGVGGSANPAAPEARAGGAADGGTTVNAAAVPAVRTKVARRASLTLEVARRRFDERFVAARGVAGRLGGFVEQSESGGTSGTLTLRVPADRLDEALVSLRELGTVTAQSDRGDDVTAQYVDLDARIRNLQSQAGVLRELMGRAETVADTITVSNQLFAVQEQIEQLTGQRNQLDDQTTFASIAVTMRVPGAAPAEPAPRSTLAAAWHDAWDVAVAIVAGCVVVLGAVVPLALLVGIGAIIWLGLRRRRPTGVAAGV